MEDGRQPKAAIWAIAFALATAIITYLQFSASLTTSRPRLHGPPETSTIGDQKILSRLWQDPFSGQDVHDDQCDLSSVRCLSNVWANGRGAFGSTNVSIMGIMVESFPYPEDVEQRLRTRYAVETAFFDRGFNPVDRSHIGMAEIHWPTTTWLNGELSDINWLTNLATDTNLTQSVRTSVPFEWMEKDQTHVLVLWLAEEQFSDYPLRRCEMLLRSLGGTNAQATNFTLIGPRSSNTLKEMAGELERTNLNALLPNLTKACFKIYSSQATAPDTLVLPGTNPVCTVQAPREVIQKQFSVLTNCVFTNYIVTDDVLAEKIADELSLRGLKLGENGDYVALISESDTSYGRALPGCIAAAIRLKGASNSIAWTDTNVMKQFTDLVWSNFYSQRQFPSNVLRFSYLRGLDGGVAEEQPESAGKAGVPQNEKKDKNDPVTRGEQDRERSQGQPQLDYLRRLAMSFEDTEDVLADNGRHIRAIGVLGSDTYDKLLLLKALRHQFKDKVFFATDLDARYQDSQERDDCRNLIIASADGLKPKGEDGVDANGLPAFRDVYQTTMFKACEAALGGGVPAGTNAHIYEIGLDRTVELGVPNEHDYLKRVRLRWWALLVGLAGVLALLTMFRGVARAIANVSLDALRAYKMWRCEISNLTGGSNGVGTKRNANGDNQPQTTQLNGGGSHSGSKASKANGKPARIDIRVIRILRTLKNRHFLNKPDGDRFSQLERVSNREDVMVLLTLVLGIVIIAVFTVSFWNSSQEPDGEPFYWCEGLSIWPTEVVRLVADMFGVVCLIHAWHSHKRQRLLLWHQIFGPKEIREPLKLGATHPNSNGEQVLLYGDGNLPLFSSEQIADFGAMVKGIDNPTDPVSVYLKRYFEADQDLWKTIQTNVGHPDKADDTRKLLAQHLNVIITSRSILEDCWVDIKPRKKEDGKQIQSEEWECWLCSRSDPGALRIRLRQETARLAEKNPGGNELVWLNRQAIDTKFRDQLLIDTKGTPIKRKAPPLPNIEPKPKIEPKPEKSFAQQSGRSLLKDLVQLRLDSSINFWPLEPDVVHAGQPLFTRYLTLGKGGYRAIRVSLKSIFLLAFGFGMFFFEGLPYIPGRGWSITVDHCILVPSIIIATVLAIYVADAARLTERFLLRLGDGATVWPQHQLLKAALDRNMDPAHLGGYLDVRFAAFHTRELGRLVYYPFIMLAIFLVARNELFAPWTWPWSLLTIALTNSVMVFLSAFYIRRAAARIRDQAIESLRAVQIKYTADEAEPYKWTLELGEGGKKQCQATNYSVKVERLIEEMKCIKSGAYARLIQDDSVVAALIPALGAGILSVFQRFFL